MTDTERLHATNALRHIATNLTTWADDEDLDLDDLTERITITINHLHEVTIDIRERHLLRPAARTSTPDSNTSKTKPSR